MECGRNTWKNVLWVVVFVGMMTTLEATIVTGFNYGDALDKTLLFFEAQRSGKLPPDQRVKWRGDSGLQDGFLQGVNLVGGYYDAGDHVKFGLPMAFTMTMLSWGTIEYRKEIVELNQMGHTLAAIKWGTDYLIKAHTQPNVLWGQVGDGESDHYCWERAEDMTTPRNAYKIDTEHPGSDLAAESSAALASASIAFHPYNSSYSNLLLLHAKQLFLFADGYRGFYDDSIQSAKQFYVSSGYMDELLWAAIWLYKATNDEYYLKYVIDNAVSMGGTGWATKEFSWDNKYAGLQILLSKVLLDGAGGAYTSTLKQYQAKADFFACANMQKNDGYNVALTPGGLIYVREWNNMQYAASAAFLLAVYSDYLSKANSALQCPNGPVQAPDIFKFAKSQADYMLGENPKSQSYIVGYGENYPVHVHHRGASISSIYLLQSSVGCVQGYESWYRRPQPNPNVIYGALVGGPGNKDDYADDRSNYEQSEPTISAAGPLVGLFAKLQSLMPPPSGIPNHYTPGPYHQEQPKPNQHISDVEFFHAIAGTWNIGTTTYYRHKVIIKNVSQKPITDLQLTLEGLTGNLWGLSKTQEKNTYMLPIKVLQPGEAYTFVYIQGGAQAKITVKNYH